MPSCGRIWNVRTATIVRYMPIAFVAGREMDVRALSLEDASFDVALDKGGVILQFLQLV